MKNLRPVLVKRRLYIDNPKYDKSTNYGADKIPHPFIEGELISPSAKKCYKPDYYEAWFHCWGLEVQEEDNGIASESLAIVEMNNGEIRTAPPEQIHFKDK